MRHGTVTPRRVPPIDATRSIRISDDLWARFKTASEAHHRSRGDQARLLIENFVTEYEASAA